MFKACPNCGFLVALIAGREASQRCPRCGTGMLEPGAPLPEPIADEPARPLRRVVERQPVADESANTGSPYPSSPEAEARGRHDDADESRETANDVDTPSTAVAEQADEPRPQPSADAPHAPSFAARRARIVRARGRRWPWIAAVGALALLLALQLIFSQRAELSQDARWRPLVASLCGAVGCTVPAWHEPAAYAMLGRNVRPARPGVLHVTATLRNDARWPQAQPVVVLSLSDIDGRIVGARAIRPADYSRRPAATVAPGDSIDIAFDVREPAAHVDAFDFQVR